MNVSSEIVSVQLRWGCGLAQCYQHGGAMYNLSFYYQGKTGYTWIINTCMVINSNSKERCWLFRATSPSDCCTFIVYLSNTAKLEAYTAVWTSMLWFLVYLCLPPTLFIAAKHYCRFCWFDIPLSTYLFRVINKSDHTLKCITVMPLIICL